MLDIRYPMCLTNLLEDHDYGNQQWLISVKYDGIRAFCQNKKISKRGIESCLFGRSLKAIPNKNIQKIFCEYWDLLRGLDGEILHKEDFGNSAMAKASGIAMSLDEPLDNFIFRIFNYFGDGSAEYCAKPFIERMADAKAKLIQLPALLQKHIVIVEQTPCASIEQAKAFAEQAELAGYEGAVLMTADAPYLQRRVLPKSPFGIKIKSIADAEATVLGFEPAYYSHGKTVPAELRGKAKAEVGAIHCRCAGFEDFKIGTGFSKKEAEAMWANQTDYIGRRLTFQYMACGSTDRPRQPRAKGFRDMIDLDTIGAQHD